MAGDEDIQAEAQALTEATEAMGGLAVATATGAGIGTATASDTHYAFVEILRTENGRQYGLNAYSSESTSNMTRATKLKIQSDTLAEGGGTGTCPGIGTQVFSVDSGSKKNLIFRK